MTSEEYFNIKKQPLETCPIIDILVKKTMNMNIRLKSEDIKKEDFEKFLDIANFYIKEINKNILKIIEWNQEWYNKLEKDFPDHGLSKTNFEYNNLEDSLKLLSSKIKEKEYNDILNKSGFNIEGIENLRKVAMKFRKEGQDIKDIYKYTIEDKYPEKIEELYSLKENSIEIQQGILKKINYKRKKMVK